MRRTDTFEVKTVKRDPDPRILLTRPGEDTVVEVDAVELRAQYLMHDGDVLLVLDEDSPYEEQVHLVLVRGAQVVDHVVISAPYASGIYRETAAEDGLLRFRFEGDAVWTVSADGSGARGPGGLPSGARRRGGWLAKHYLQLSWTPGA